MKTQFFFGITRNLLSVKQVTSCFSSFLYLLTFFSVGDNFAKIGNIDDAN